jgi:hypothetical protein
MLLLQQPIVVEVAKAPSETARISYAEVILGAAGAVGVIMLVALLIGLTVGAVIVYRKKRHDATAPVTGSGHVKLEI